MPTRSGAAGASSSGRRHHNRTGDGDQGERHEERAVAEQRGQPVAERPADRTGQVGGEGEAGEQAEHEHTEGEGIGAVPAELGPGRLADARRGGAGRPLAFFAGGFAPPRALARDVRALDPLRDFVVATKSP